MKSRYTCKSINNDAVLKTLVKTDTSGTVRDVRMSSALFHRNTVELFPYLRCSECHRYILLVFIKNRMATRRKGGTGIAEVAAGFAAAAFMEGDLPQT